MYGHQIGKFECGYIIMGQYITVTVMQYLMN